MLSLRNPQDMIGEDIAVIGYPAFDPRNRVDVQNKVFDGVYKVKRLQPGQLRPRQRVESFGNRVFAAAHDSSTPAAIRARPYSMSRPGRSSPCTLAAST